MILYLKHRLPVVVLTWQPIDGHLAQIHNLRKRYFATIRDTLLKMKRNRCDWPCQKATKVSRIV